MNYLKQIGEALASIEGVNAYHYWRPQMQAPYIVWAEDGEETSLEANSHKREQMLRGYVDLFTKNEFDELFYEVQKAMNSLDNVMWNLESVQYEDETNLIHYEWRFYVFGKVYE